MNKALRFWVGIAIILVAFLLPYFKSTIDNVVEKNSVAKILKIEKPSAELIARNVKIDSIVNNEEDRKSLAVFTHVFSKRVPRYETTVDNFDKIFVFAGKEVYNTGMRGKYQGLKEFFTTTMENSIGDKNTLTNQEERNKLSEDFNTISWILSESSK
jgi:hypothetical protein